MSGEVEPDGHAAPGRILVGTASWTDKSVVESGWYPADAATPEARLRYYAAQFPVVEVDSSYYGLPDPRTATLWVARTPGDFIFDVKAFRIFTGHHTTPASLPKDLREALGPVAKKNLYYRDLPDEITAELWARFHSSLEPLRQAGRLGAVLFQFAPWFVSRRASFEHIEHCVTVMQGFAIAAEFRNRSWFDERHWDRVLAFERAHGLVHVVVDEPQGFSGSVPPVWEATSPELAIVRLHGRNRETWERKGLASSSERFDYLYGDDELQELAGHVQILGTRVKRLHVLFNNCRRDNAQVNAANFLKRVAPGI